MMTLDQLIADTAEQQRHAFVVDIPNKAALATTWSPHKALDLAMRLSANATITRNGRLLWPRP